MFRFQGYRPNPPEEYRAKGIAAPPDEVQYEGIVFGDGTVVLRWTTAYRSHSVWASFADFEQVHLHPEYGSYLVWHDGLPAGLSAVARELSWVPFGASPNWRNTMGERRLEFAGADESGEPDRERPAGGWPVEGTMGRPTAELREHLERGIVSKSDAYAEFLRLAKAGRLAEVPQRWRSLYEGSWTPPGSAQEAAELAKVRRSSRVNAKGQPFQAVDLPSASASSAGLVMPKMMQDDLRRAIAALPDPGLGRTGVADIGSLIGFGHDEWVAARRWVEDQESAETETIITEGEQHG
ncbi:MAG TPA: hypothetical protein VGH72_33730 [Pseudonocardia sp.]|jgi:hypothetical protein